MDLVHVWVDDRYWSKMLRNTIPTPIHDLKVSVTDFFMFKFYVKGFRTSLFLNCDVFVSYMVITMMIDTGPKLCTVTIPIHIHDLKIKVRDLELLY